MKLPNKSDYPDYYQIVTEPYSFTCMLRKAKRVYKSYASLDELRYEFEKMVANAKLYNEEGSQIWKQADALSREFNSAHDKEGKLEPDAVNYLTPKVSKRGRGRGGKSTSRGRRKSPDDDPDYDEAGSRRSTKKGLTITLSLGRSGRKQQEPDPTTALRQRFYEDYSGIARAGPQCRAIMVKLMALKEGKTNVCEQFMTITQAEFKPYRKKCHRILLVPNMLEGIHVRYHTLSHFRLDFERMVDNTKAFYGPGNPKTLLALKLHALFAQLYKQAEEQYPELRFVLPPKFELEEDESVMNEVLTQVKEWLAVSAAVPYGHRNEGYSPVGRWQAKRHAEHKKMAIALSTNRDESWSCLAKSAEETEQYIRLTLTSKENEDEVNLVRTLRELMHPPENNENDDVDENEAEEVDSIRIA